MNNKYMIYMKAEKRSQNTIRAYVTDIDACLSFINKPENEIIYSDLIEWKASMVDSLSSATVARKIASVKNYFKQLKKMDEIKIDPSVELESNKIRNKEKVPLNPSEIRAMIDCADKLRSKAIITMLASTGMRISELINLTIEEYNKNPITIIGKGNKKRNIYLTLETRNTVNQYLETRPDSQYDNVFLSNGAHPLQANNVSLMLKNTAYKAGIENWNEISNHWLRTSAATMQSEAGQPIEVIQEMLGHSSITTTRRYVKVSHKHLENAMTTQLF